MSVLNIVSGPAYTLNTTATTAGITVAFPGQTIRLYVKNTGANVVNLYFTAAAQTAASNPYALAAGATYDFPVETQVLYLTSVGGSSAVTVHAACVGIAER